MPNKDAQTDAAHSENCCKSGKRGANNNHCRTSTIKLMGIKVKRTRDAEKSR